MTLDVAEPVPCPDCIQIVETVPTPGPLTSAAPAARVTRALQRQHGHLGPPGGKQETFAPHTALYVDFIGLSVPPRLHPLISGGGEDDHSTAPPIQGRYLRKFCRLPV